MQISGRFNKYLTNSNLSSQKQSNTTAKESVPNNNSDSISHSHYGKYVNSYNVPFLAKKKPDLNKAKFQIQRTFNTDNIPDKFRINDEQAIKLITKAQKKATTNTNAKYSGASHGISALLVNSADKINVAAAKKYKIITRSNSEIKRGRTFCGELQIVIDLLDSNKLNELIAIAISRPNITGKAGDSITPCSICCATFQDIYKESQKFKKGLENFQYVQFVIPEKLKGDEIKLNIMTLYDLLPQINDKTPSLTNKNIEGLVKSANIHLSISALDLKDKLLSDLEIKNLIISAQKAYEKSSDKAGAAVLTENNEIFNGIRIGPKARMSESADKIAIIHSKMNSNSKIKALAIYEKDNTLPDIENIPWLPPDIQIIVIKDDKVFIRTVKDYMPYAHKCIKNHSDSCDFNC